MANCPRCGTALKDEYGMSQCPGCGAFSFIGMDGEAVIQQEEPAASESRFDQITQIPPHLPEPGGAAAPSEFGDPIEGLMDFPSSIVSNDDTVDESSNTSYRDSAFVSVDAPSTADSQVMQELMNAEFESIDMSPASHEPRDETAEAPSPQGFGPAHDPLNLNDFANSEVSSAKDGPLLFRVLISGIDTKEIRDSIREVLEDSRFAWDSNEIFSKVSKGRLAIDDLSPVKASILITRIKRLPVQIRWEQYAITQGQI